MIAKAKKNFETSIIDLCCGYIDANATTSRQRYDCLGLSKKLTVAVLYAIELEEKRNGDGNKYGKSWSRQELKKFVATLGDFNTCCICCRLHCVSLPTPLCFIEIVSF